MIIMSAGANGAEINRQVFGFQNEKRKMRPVCCAHLSPRHNERLVAPVSEGPTAGKQRRAPAGTRSVQWHLEEREGGGDNDIPQDVGAQ